MRGPDEMREKLVTLFRQAGPPKIELLRQQWDYDTVALPDISAVISGELPDGALTSTQFGANLIDVINPRMLNTKQVDIDPYGQPVMMTRYSAQVFVWCQANEWAAAIRARDNLITVTRLCLLEWPNLTYNAYGNTNFRLHPDTYTESFDPPYRLVSRAGGKLWCPGRVAIDVDREDDIHDGSLRPPLGTADTIAHAAQAVGPGQPLPGEDTP